MDTIHRILAGNPEHRKELIAAGLFVAVWFVIDVIQFADWAMEKFHKEKAVSTCSSVVGYNMCFTPANIIAAPTGKKAK